MSSAVASTSAASGRLFVFDEEIEGEVRPRPASARVAAAIGEQARIQQSRILRSRILPSSVTPASQLEVRPAPEMVSSGIAALDALAGGLPRGCLTEICGPASSGRTTVMLAALAAATHRGEFCVLVDASDALDPKSAAAAGVNLDRMLWVRCGEGLSSENNSPQRHPSASLRACSGKEKNFRDQKLYGINRSEHCLEQVLRATDLLLESGGFGMIVLDLADLPPQLARRIPLTTWFRFRRAVEHKPTILLAIEQQAIAGGCSSLLLQFGVPSTQYPVPSGKPSHADLLSGLGINVELIHSRIERKPSRSTSFETRTAWAG